MTITPDQARALLNGASPGPWDEDTSNILNSDGDALLSDWSFGDPHWYNALDITLMAAAPDLAQAIAGMRWEYGVQWDEDHISWLGTNLPECRRSVEANRDEDLSPWVVRRLVGPVEEVEAEW
ncbi:hypothetical protein [Corynebacterium neomassiliense]|uniref:hypothetical protein n=1 Tax=Corynebacterium neomassiliense TaxID=2079482 RepID=UPI001031F5D6|nr:hypothetical protein [Corynebacterium neomassiliense]